MNKSFWIINISKQNVCLADLGLTVPAGRSMNLLDQRHFTYTLEQLENSAKSGSLFKKSDRIKRRGIPNTRAIKPSRFEVSTEPREVRRQNLVQVEEFNYDELPSLKDEQFISDQKFAEEFATDDQFK